MELGDAVRPLGKLEGENGHAETVLIVLGVAAPAGAIASGAHNAPLGWPSRGQSQGDCPWVGSSLPAAQLVADVMSQMTVAQEITLVEGDGIGTGDSPYIFYTPGIPSLCIPAMGLEDGAQGVADGMNGVTQLPAPVALAATWDPTLAQDYGQVIGTEQAGKGVSVDLGPMVNIDRDPRFGRSFETFSEDPFLTASMSTSEIEGIQNEGVMAMVKHFDAYNQETYRGTPADDVIVDPRVREEIYMPAFQAAVQQAGAASLMCAYSSVNGNGACESNYLLNQVLKQQWDFPGFVTSDFGAITSDAAGVDGDDMEQPENTYFGAPLAADVGSGAIPQAVLNTMVQRILTEMFRFDLITDPLDGSSTARVTSLAHDQVATEVAEQGATLLQNNNQALPLPAAGAGTVAVIGPAASAAPAYSGSGSAEVDPSLPVTPLVGIKAAAKSGTSIVYQQGLPTDASLPAIPSSALSPAYASTPSGGSYAGTLTAPQTGTYVIALRNTCLCYLPTYLYLNGQELIANPSTSATLVYSASVSLTAGQSYLLTIDGPSTGLLWATPSALAPSIAQAVAAASTASAAVVVVSDDTESEAADRPSLELPSAQDELIEAVAAVNPRTIVVVDAGAPIAMPWLSQVAAVLYDWYPGQVNGTALASVLFGNSDPGGHLPVTFPTSLSEIPTSTLAQFPGTDGEVLYSEGLDVGYRWYDANDVAPLFPFGYGLSYTTFSFSNLSVSPDVQGGVGNIAVSATLTNTGTVAGSDVAQLYLGDPPAAGEPPRQLVGFQSVSLAPGQSTQVNFTISPKDTWWWDDATNGWSQSTGTYQVYVGDSSALANLPLQGSFTMNTSPGARQVAINAPSTFQPGVPSTVTVQLTPGGNQTVSVVTFALQLPAGWTGQPVGKSVFLGVTPTSSPTETFSVTPPSGAPSSIATVHATANLSLVDQLQAGVSATVG